MERVLLAAAEAAPFVKSGGLGDVVGSLPKALKAVGVDARILVPRYRGIAPEYQNRMRLMKEFIVPVGWRRQYCGLMQLEYGGMIYYFLDNRYYFDRPGLYGFYDEAERFAYFCRAVLAALPYLDFSPQILHCHDWHTGLVGMLLNRHYRREPLYEQMKIMFTIHNLKYQGIFNKQIMGDILDLGWDCFTPEGLEFYDQVSFMKAALTSADIITTVSRSYADEIQTPFYGENLDGLLRRRQHDLFGIANGIDYDLYDPSHDPAIAARFDADNPDKRENKRQLQQLFGLPIAADIPLFAVVSRLVSQKGMDLIVRVMEEILALPIQLIIVGTGEERYEQMFFNKACYHAEKLAVRICFQEELARQIYAGADVLLMPSLFEPCGISQLIAMRYGTLPLVRETGGLRDTVIPYNEFTGAGNGFSFTNYNAHDMLFTIERAVALYQDQTTWRRIVINAMQGDFSWKRSAQHYAELYRRILEEAAYGTEQGNLQGAIFGSSNDNARQEFCGHR